MNVTTHNSLRTLEELDLCSTAIRAWFSYLP